jgi:opacity protein-like surface antigen
MRLLCLSLLLITAQAHAQLDLRGVIGEPYLRFAAGSFSTERSTALEHQGGRYGFAVGIGGRRSANFAWEFEFLQTEQRADTPPGLISSGLFFGTARKADISTFGFAGNVRLIYPLGGFEPYVGAGLGYFRTELTAMQSVLGFPGEVRRSDSGLGTQWLAGLQYRSATRYLWGLQFRKLDLEAQFGPDVPGRAKIGGTLRMLYLGRAY